MDFIKGGAGADHGEILEVFRSLARSSRGPPDLHGEIEFAQRLHGRACRRAPTWARPAATWRLNATIERRPFSIHSSNRFALSEGATVHRALQHRHLVRMILTID